MEGWAKARDNTDGSGEKRPNQGRGFQSLPPFCLSGDTQGHDLDTEGLNGPGIEGCPQPLLGKGYQMRDGPNKRKAEALQTASTKGKGTTIGRHRCKGLAKLQQRLNLKEQKERQKDWEAMKRWPPPVTPERTSQ